MTLSLLAPPPGDVPDNVVAIIAIVSIFVLFPIVIAFARRVWKQSTEPRSLRLPDETVHRLTQMQQSIDAMAIELERISEGQRFVTKIMAERAPAALPASSKKGRAAATD